MPNRENSNLEEMLDNLNNDEYESTESNKDASNQEIDSKDQENDNEVVNNEASNQEDDSNNEDNITSKQEDQPLDNGNQIINNAKQVFDESFYLNSNKKLKFAIRDKSYSDAFDHFVKVGCQKGYSPNADLEIAGQLDCNSLYEAYVN